jgi:hypothetical protein
VNFRAKILLRICPALVCACTAFGASQKDTASSMARCLQTQYGSVEHSPISTGIWHDLALPLSHISEHKGDQTSEETSLAEWLQISYELRQATLRESELPEPAVFLDMGRTAHREHIYPLALLNFRFNRVRSGVPLDSALYVREGRVVALNENAFQEDRVFAVSTLHSTTYRGADTQFRMDLDALYYSNDPPLQKVEIDFDDGLGYRQVPRQGDIAVHFRSVGRKLVRVRAVQSDGIRLFAAFPFSVVTLTTPDPASTWSVQATIPFNGQYRTGDAYLYLADGHDTLTNPIVVSEGFDLYNDMNWDELYALLNQQNLLETVRSMGYDAVVLNYTDATDYVEGNALVLEALLERVQQVIDSTRSLALIGPSMGGLTTRYALCYMEANGIPHRVRTWIAFDAPQRGAVIPLGLQYWVDFFAPYSSDAVFLRDALNSPAAREMLITHFTDPPSNVAGSDPLRATLLAAFTAVGNYPMLPRKVAVANGSGSGADAGFSPGDQLIQYQYSSLFISITGNVWALNNVASQQIFNGLFRVFPLVNDQESVTVDPTWPWDNAPGGLRNSMYQMDTTAAPYGDIIALHANHCFIPTISALDLDVQNPFFDIMNAPDLYSLSPFDSLYFPAENQEHVTITPQNLWWFLAEACDSLAAPMVVITPDSNVVHLDWLRVNGARSYRVFVATDVETWPTSFVSTSDTTWVDSDLSPRQKFYRVAAATDSAAPTAVLQGR